MFIVDGIAYASEPKDGLLIEDVKTVHDLCMVVRFSTGEERVFDATPLLDAPAFAPLQDQAVFGNAKIEHGILTWLDGEVDISPEKVYAMSYSYSSAENNSMLAYA